MTILMKVEKLIMQGTGVKKNCYAWLLDQQGQALREASEWYINGICTLRSAVELVKHY